MNILPNELIDTFRDHQLQAIDFISSFTSRYNSAKDSKNRFGLVLIPLFSERVNLFKLATLYNQDINNVLILTSTLSESGIYLNLLRNNNLNVEFPEFEIKTLNDFTPRYSEKTVRTKYSKKNIVVDTFQYFLDQIKSNPELKPVFSKIFNLIIYEYRYLYNNNEIIGELSKIECPKILSSSFMSQPFLEDLYFNEEDIFRHTFNDLVSIEPQYQIKFINRKNFTNPDEFAEDIKSLINGKIIDLGNADHRLLIKCYSVEEIIAIKNYLVKNLTNQVIAVHSTFENDDRNLNFKTAPNPNSFQEQIWIYQNISGITELIDFNYVAIFPQAKKEHHLISLVFELLRLSTNEFFGLIVLDHSEQNNYEENWEHWANYPLEEEGSVSDSVSGSGSTTSDDTTEYTYSDITIDSESEKSFLKVEDIADILSNIIINSRNKITTTSQEDRFYGIFGRWGRGKTHLWKLLKERFKEHNKYKPIEFHAWKYQDTPAIWGYLYETISSYYYHKPKRKIFIPFVPLRDMCFSLWLSLYRNFNQFLLFVFGIVGVFISYRFAIDSNFKILSIEGLYIGVPSLVTIYTGFNTLTKPIVSKTKAYIKTFGKKVDYSEHLGLQHEIQCELRHLLKAWNKTIVLFIDDIDRCKNEKIIDIVDSIRIMLNDEDIQEHLIVIAAIDHSILKDAIRKKYEETTDKSTIEIRVIEYFDKLFIAGLKLEKLNRNQIEEVFMGITDPYLIKSSDISVEKKEVVINDKTDGFDELIYKNTGSLPINQDYENQQQDTQDELPKENATSSNLPEKIETQITPNEQKFLKELIKNLDGATPRSIRNFFIKYRIARSLVYILRYKNIQNDSEWVENDNAKKLLAKLIIDIMNLDDKHRKELDSQSNELKIAMGRALDMINYYD